MMSTSTWDDTKDDLDIWSVMMYPWYGFITSEASSAGLATMNDIATGVPVQKPRQGPILTLFLLRGIRNMVSTRVG